jgi:integrase/recombinase XerD
MRTRRGLSPADALASLASTAPVASGARTLHELATGFLRWLSDARRLPEHTSRSYGDALGAFLTYAAGIGVAYPAQCSVLTIDGFYIWLRGRGLAPATMQHRRSVLISFWSFLVHEGFADRNIPKKTYPIKAAKRMPVYLEPHQIDDFLAKLATLNDLTGRRDYAVVATFFYLGVRVAELSNRCVTDVDLVANRVHVTLGNGGQDRIVYLPPRLRPILASYLAETRPPLVSRQMGEIKRPYPPKHPTWGVIYQENGRRVYRAGMHTEAEARRALARLAPRPKDGGWLFVNAAPRNGHRLRRTGQPILTRSWFWTIRHRAEQFLGFRLSPHKLRHTCATYLLYHGAQPETIQRLLGHADVRTTMGIYAHTPQKRQEEEIGRIFA